MLLGRGRSKVCRPQRPVNSTQLIATTRERFKGISAPRESNTMAREENEPTSGIECRLIATTRERKDISARESEKQRREKKNEPTSGVERRTRRAARCFRAI